MSCSVIILYFHQRPPKLTSTQQLYKTRNTFPVMMTHRAPLESLTISHKATYCCLIRTVWPFERFETMCLLQSLGVGVTAVPESSPSPPPPPALTRQSRQLKKNLSCRTCTLNVPSWISRTSTRWSASLVYITKTSTLYTFFFLQAHPCCRSLWVTLACW